MVLQAEAALRLLNWEAYIFRNTDITESMHLQNNCNFLVCKQDRLDWENHHSSQRRGLEGGEGRRGEAKEL